MKILFLSAPFRYYKGGSELQYSLIEEYLKARGFEVCFLFRYDEPVDEPGCYTYRYRLRRNYSRHCVTDSLRIYSLIREIEPDLIYKRGVNYISAIGLSYAHRHGIRYVQHIASNYDTGLQKVRTSGLRALFDKIVTRYVISRADSIIAQAEYQNEALQENFDRTADIIIPNVIPEPASPAEKPPGVQVVWIANLKKVKAPEVFIRLAGELGQSQCRFVMIGRDPQSSWSEELKSMISETASLEYLGERTYEEVNEILGMSHVFVNTSLHEGFPNTYLQAAVHRMPIVTLNVDPDGIIESRRMGFHSRTFEKLVENTSELIRNDSLRCELGENAHRYVTEVHGLKNIDQMINLFKAWKSC